MTSAFTSKKYRQLPNLWNPHDAGNLELILLTPSPSIVFTICNGRFQVIGCSIADSNTVDLGFEPEAGERFLSLPICLQAKTVIKLTPQIMNLAVHWQKTLYETILERGVI